MGIYASWHDHDFEEAVSHVKIEIDLEMIDAMSSSDGGYGCICALQKVDSRLLP